jgi:2-polyprenyl-3-methyl-5-hydroxy-6-metoxy-1,4-benzoquinol methylase
MISQEGRKKTINTTFDKDRIKYSLLLLSKRYNYNRWIYDNIHHFIGEDILEVGAGIGNITDFIILKNNLTLIDINQNYIDYLNSKYSFRDKLNFDALNVDIQNIKSSHLATKNFDTIICLNILEHLENDRAAIENMSYLLRPKGRLIILVPALKTLYGSMDIAFEHYRRYNKKELRSLIHGQNLQEIKFHYLNFFGLLGWFFNGRILKKKELPEKQTKLFDQLVPFLSFAEKIIKPPLGQSLILVAQKK